ncbi:uncharacterized protein N7446_007945 [Penicillium canescens]|uniref:uncharacterized protein n=1 Tax=Penicillium canescens TaxID=5083 RepID=UPI0026DEFC67|nr:uncharacterized protein N7446_007945 [Penicillium canescens]KAJ6058362.1 hypothetical protein N7446_007945 [Penicillium canescens]
MQWLSAIIANTWDPDGQEEIKDAYLPFSFALAIAAIIMTSGFSCFYFIEVFVVICMFFGGMFVVFVTPRTSVSHWKLRLLILVYLYMGMTFWNSWFWFSSQKNVVKPTPCGTVLFLFAKVSGNNLHRAVHFYQALSIIGSLYCTIVGGVILPRDEDTAMLGDKTFLVVSIFTFIVNVFAIELTLIWNNVSEINTLSTVGQLIPFIIGAWVLEAYWTARFCSAADLELMAPMVTNYNRCLPPNMLRRKPKTLSAVHLRIFLTSRPDLPIRLGFSEIKNQDYQDLVLHDIPEAVTAHDISLFLNWRLSKIRKERSPPVDWPRNTDTQTLVVTLSVPLFIFAATVCRVFEDPQWDPVDSLTEILTHRSDGSQLNGTYLPVLNRLINNQNGKRKKQLIQEFQEVVGTIVMLESPL